MIFWGNELTVLYNDAAISIVGHRHPSAFGASARDVFAPIWSDVGTAMDVTMRRMQRSLVRIADREYEYVPIEENGRAAGVFCTATAIGPVNARIAETDRALAERFADVIPQMMWIADANGKRLYQNKSWGERTGYGHLDDGALTVHPDDREETLSQWKYAVSTGTPFSQDYRLWFADERRYSWVHGRAQPIVEEGTIVRWVGITSDIDRRKREEFAVSFLSDASTKLNATLEPTEILEAAARLPLGTFAEFAFAYVYRDGRLLRIAAIHSDPRKQKLVDDMVRAAGDPQLSPQAHKLLLLGEPMLYADIDDATLFDWAESPAHGDAMVRGDLRSMIRAPIEVAGRIIGAISVCRTSDSARFDTTDVRLVTDLARRTSIAVANADIYQREHRIALSFQDAAMPRSLGERRGATVRGYYVPGSSDARVGGDWYDASVLPDGRIIFSIGDVSGSGLDAAVVMSMVRYSIRSAAYMLADPVAILDAADAIVSVDSKGHFVTAFVGIADPITMDMRYANAGHPAPVVLSGDSVTELSDAVSLPLGIAKAAQRTVAHERFESPATIFAYTDGLIEGEGEFLPGVPALLEMLRSESDPRAIYSALLPHGSRDDTAILTLRLDESQLHDRISRIDAPVRNEGDASSLRQRVSGLLAMHGLSDSALDDASLAVGEIIANVARHAPGDTTIIVDPTMEQLVVHVIDSGRGFVYQPQLPTSTLAESGRGMYIATALTFRFSVSPTPERGSHVRMVFVKGDGS